MRWGRFHDRSQRRKRSRRFLELKSEIVLTYTVGHCETFCRWHFIFLSPRVFRFQKGMRSLRTLELPTTGGNIRQSSTIERFAVCAQCVESHSKKRCEVSWINAFWGDWCERAYMNIQHASEMVNSSAKILHYSGGTVWFQSYTVAAAEICIPI